MSSIFSAFLSTLGGYTSNAFILSSFIPTLVFAVLNVVILVFVSPSVRDGIFSQFDALTGGFYFGAILVATAILAYCLSAANTYMREVLEGRHIWPNVVRDQKCREQFQRSQRLRFIRTENLRLRVALDGAVAGWTKALDAAREVGIDDSPGTATYPAARRRKWFRRIAASSEDRSVTTTEQKPSQDAIASAAQNAIAILSSRMRDGREITQTELERAVVAIKAVLGANDLNAGEDGTRIRSDYATLLSAFAYAKTLYASAEAAAYRERQFAFGNNSIAPTRAGNIAASMQTYAETRYSIDLDFFWGRIQSLAVSDKTADSLIAAKTQLDFFVGVCWLSAFSWLGWVLAFGAMGYSWVQFVAVTGLFACVAALAYELLVLSYLNFCDAVRVTIDFNRLALLTKLHIALPGSAVEERLTWGRLAQIAAYGQPELNISYTE